MEPLLTAKTTVECYLVLLCGFVVAGEVEWPDTAVAKMELGCLRR